MFIASFIQSLYQLHFTHMQNDRMMMMMMIIIIRKSTKF